MLSVVPQRSGDSCRRQMPVFAHDRSVSTRGGRGRRRAPYVERAFWPAGRLSRLESGGGGLHRRSPARCGCSGSWIDLLARLPSPPTWSTSGSMSVRPQIQLRDSAGFPPDFPTSRGQTVAPGVRASKALPSPASHPKTRQRALCTHAMLDLGSLQQLAVRNGLNLFGWVDAAIFDAAQPVERRSSALLPGCGTILVLGTGGRSPWVEFQQQGRPLASADDPGCVDDLVDAATNAVGQELAAAHLRHLRVDSGGAKISFQRLGEAAGFGVVSPVSGMLLHPDFGPWLRVRTALLVLGSPFGPLPDASVSSAFQPCSGCAQPCVGACGPQALDGHAGVDLARCGAHRRRGGCSGGCEARMACPLGREHADRPGQPVHAHTADSPWRHQGAGWWRLLPRSIRRLQGQS